jgi:hypothetical protein
MAGTPRVAEHQAGCRSTNPAGVGEDGVIIAEAQAWLVNMGGDMPKKDIRN